MIPGTSDKETGPSGGLISFFIVTIKSLRVKIAKSSREQETDANIESGEKCFIFNPDTFSTELVLTNGQNRRIL